MSFLSGTCSLHLRFSGRKLAYRFGKLAYCMLIDCVLSYNCPKKTYNIKAGICLTKLEMKSIFIIRPKAPLVNPFRAFYINSFNTNLITVAKHSIWILWNPTIAIPEWHKKQRTENLKWFVPTAWERTQSMMRQEKHIRSTGSRQSATAAKSC